MDDYTLVTSLNQKMNDLSSDINELQTSNVINNSIIGNINNSVNDVNKEIKKINGINFKRVCIRNIKVFGNIMKLVIHPLLALALAFGFSRIALNDIPFQRQDVVSTMHYEETIDNLGNKELNNGYSNTNWFTMSPNEKNNWLYKYGKWEKRDNDYYRTIDEYIINGYPKENIQELFDNFSKLKESYSFTKLTTYETKGEVSSEELALNNYMKAVYHYTDENDSYIAPQSEEENVSDTVFFLGMLFGFGLVSSAVVTDIINRKLSHGYRVIGEDYVKLDIDDIKKQFHEKRIEFEKMQKELKKERTI